MYTTQDVNCRKSEAHINTRTSFSHYRWNYVDGVASTLINILGLRDPYLLVHSQRVAKFAKKLAKRMGLSKEQVDLVKAASLFHDIGKLGIAQEILSKPEMLTPCEYETVKTHTVNGAVLLRECPEYHSLMPIIRHHHEFFNGRGYPDKIIGDQIEIEARIISVAEAVTAMSSDGPYHQAFSVQQIVDELQRCANAQFDPNVVDVAVQILQETNILV